MKKITPNRRIVHQAKIVLQVQLDKQVPIAAASLGGGSWNAATALWAASQRNENVPSEKTFRLGQQM
jgi:4-diphosphocytidyl-2C-methyl-D-erythritol kinase